MGGEKVKINDLQYLLKKLGEKAVPKTNREYLLAVSKYPGKEFKSAVGVSWSCNPKRDIRRWTPDPDPVKAAAGQGTRQEITGQVGNVIFAEGAPIILDWSKNSVDAVLLSRQAAIEAAGSFGALFTAAGMIARVGS